jgi:hypothetical protein
MANLNITINSKFNFSEEAEELLTEIIPLARHYKDDIAEYAFLKALYEDEKLRVISEGNFISQNTVNGLYKIYRLMKSFEYSSIEERPKVE